MVMREAMRVKGLPIPNTYQGVVDLYDVSDDWIPIYDKSELPGFYMAVGTSGNQYKNAPVAGAMMAGLINACEGGLDHDRKPFQFDLKYLDRQLDAGFFSRNREINENSSFSVIG
jgi:sarcosine oxidase subunit beta